MYEIIEKIAELCYEYMDYIDEIGNECAYTDRIVEAIYEEAEVLHKKYDEYFESLDIDALMEEVKELERPFIEKANAEIEKMIKQAKNKSSDERKD